MVAEKDTWPEFLQKLDALYGTTRPGRKSLRGCDLFLIDLSSWRLQFSNRTPLIWVPAALVTTVATRELADVLRDIARELGWQSRNCLVVLEGDGAELKAEVAGQFSPTLIVVGAAEQRRILAASSLTTALQDVIFDLLPITSLAPYDITVPAEGSSFFGRAREIDRIVKRPATNFAIIGVRRIGKTSLMKEVRRRLQEQGDEARRIVWLDCSTLRGPEQFVQEVVRHLHPNELRRFEEPGKIPFFFSDFLRRMALMHEGRITIFLDEADYFLDWAREDQRFAKSLASGSTGQSTAEKGGGDGSDVRRTVRDTINTGSCRFIISGFQGVMAELFDNRSPLYVMFEPVQLGPLDLGETGDLVARPMRSLRVRFDREAEVVSRIFSETRGHPQLVQFYCLELLNALARQEKRVIDADSLKDVYFSEAFRALIIHPFRDNVTPRDQALVYALLTYYPEQKDSFSLEEMHGALQRKGIVFTERQIDQACDRLILAGVLIRHGQQRYQFAFPVFARMMRDNFNLEYLLAMARKETS